MKTKLAIVFVLLIVQTITAQNYQTVEDINNACSQLGFAGDEDAEIAVDNILDKMGLYRNFVIQECPNINNAVAKNIDIGSGKKERYILYDNSFFNKIDEKAGNDWAATSVLAHEIGHHLNGHALNDEGSNHKWELEADEFSGFVLARMGASLQDAQSAIQTLRYEKATSTHPAKADRLIAIETGWNRGNGKTIVVKKIDDEIIKDITENNEEEIINNDFEDDYIVVDGITAEQVISNYVNAIGGQEKIMNIKTLKQSFTQSSFSLINDETNENVNQHNLTFLTPNNLIYNLVTNFSNTKILQLDGKLYNKKDSGKWELSSISSSQLGDNYVSYIYEYSLLLTNAKLVFLGVKTIGGVSCYAIEIPKTEIVNNSDLLISKTKIYKTNYYSIDTGLLAYVKTTNIIDFDYKKETKYSKDSKTTSKLITSYLDYRPVKGVLFPFRMETKKLDSDLPYSHINEYTDIQVNPILNKEDFIVKE